VSGELGWALVGLGLGMLLQLAIAVAGGRWRRR
jgi:hypothetical protein